MPLFKKNSNNINSTEHDVGIDLTYPLFPLRKTYNYIYEHVKNLEMKLQAGNSCKLDVKEKMKDVTDKSNSSIKLLDSLLINLAQMDAVCHNLSYISKTMNKIAYSNVTEPGNTETIIERVEVPVEVKVQVPVKIPVKVPVKVPVMIPVKVPVRVKVPVEVKVPVPYKVEVPVKIAVPMRTSIPNPENLTSTIDELKENFDSLKDFASEIEEELSVIKELASQTNLLSLSASIQATKAGEAGESFLEAAKKFNSLSKEIQEQASVLSVSLDKYSQRQQSYLETLEAACSDSEKLLNEYQNVKEDMNNKLKEEHAQNQEKINEMAKKEQEVDAIISEAESQNAEFNSISESQSESLDNSSDSSDSSDNFDIDSYEITDEMLEKYAKDIDVQSIVDSYEIPSEENEFTDEELNALDSELLKSFDEEFMASFDKENTFEPNVTYETVKADKDEDKKPKLKATDEFPSPDAPDESIKDAYELQDMVKDMISNLDDQSILLKTIYGRCNDSKDILARNITQNNAYINELNDSVQKMNETLDTRDCNFEELDDILSQINPLLDQIIEDLK